MAHPEQRAFFERVKYLHPWSFKDVRVLDCGSLNVNGTLRDLFTGGTYTGVDVVAGRDVDIVCKVHEFGRLKPESMDVVFDQYDTIVSAEMLEHDPHWRLSLKRMYELLKPGGLLAISCAGPGRPEHGTPRTTGPDAVWTDPANPDYYRNISTGDIAEALGLKPRGGPFKWWELSGRETWPQDTYFWGMKA
jgi:SAM-dependent methyltransferase